MGERVLGSSLTSTEASGVGQGVEMVLDYILTPQRVCQWSRNSVLPRVSRTFDIMSVSPPPDVMLACSPMSLMPHVVSPMDPRGEDGREGRGVPPQSKHLASVCGSHESTPNWLPDFFNFFFLPDSLHCLELHTWNVVQNEHVVFCSKVSVFKILHCTVLNFPPLETGYMDQAVFLTWNKELCSE